jgi:hypothetical protein
MNSDAKPFASLETSSSLCVFRIIKDVARAQPRQTLLVRFRRISPVAGIPAKVPSPKRQQSYSSPGTTGEDAKNPRESLLYFFLILNIGGQLSGR